MDTWGEPRPFIPIIACRAAADGHESRAGHSTRADAPKCLVRPPDTRGRHRFFKTSFGSPSALLATGSVPHSTRGNPMTNPLSIPGLLVLGILLTTSAQGKTIHVPAHQPTIQQGIDAAVNGDTVLVAAGVYNEVIAIINKRVTLRSELGPLFTVIDGSGRGDVIVRVQDQSPSDNVVIQGFTVAHADPNAPGISVYGDPTSFVTIDNCWVFDNPGRGI